MSAVPQSDRVGLASVLAEVPGKWVAVDLDTNALRAVADSPAELVAELRRAASATSASCGRRWETSLSWSVWDRWRRQGCGPR